MHHLPEDLDVMFREWLNRNVNQEKLNTWTGRSLLKLAFQAGFELRDVAEGRKRAEMERQHADYRPPSYRNPSQPPFFTATRDAYVPDTDGMRAYDTHFFPIPGHEAAAAPEMPSIPPLPAVTGPETRQFPAVDAEIRNDQPPPGPRAPMETRFDYIESVWAENDKA